MCSCSLIQAQDEEKDEPCFASNMLCNLLKPNAFPLPLAFPPKRNRVDAAISMLSVSHMGCGETKADNISKETYSSHCQKFPGKKNGRTEIDFECSAMSRQKAKEVARTAGVCKPLSPRIFRPFCAYLYDSKNSNCQISLARAILPSFSWGSASFQMKRSDISRLDLADLAQTDCCGQPCRSDWDSSLLNWNVFSNG